ncbi:NAD-glutamate dehydrogenase [Motiliproteus sediminis]|uniref:NAD-glutamate dehydrogenase n=1 Tax=Motiliproteus sediminis TaxID=1468178 RepID=UPI001AEF87DE|nr:NAD-glutamate dehydrogenase [Motiliproteus sediminis]
MNKKVGHKPSALSELNSLLSERLPTERIELAQQLASQFYARASNRELLSQSAEDLYGSVLCLLDLAQNRRGGKAKIKVYNPNPEDHRWHSTHTVVEVLVSDRPFLVSSISMALVAAGQQVHRVTHPVLNVLRDGNGKLKQVLAKGSSAAKATNEALMRFEIDHQSGDEALLETRKRVEQVLDEVDAAVSDWSLMQDQLQTVIDWSVNQAKTADSDDTEEAIAFLRWLQDDHFVFLGYRHYRHEDQPDGSCQLVYQPKSGMGIFRNISADMERIALSPRLSELARSPELLILTKSTTRSTIQRPSYLDFVGVREISAAGEVIGEWRFFGLYASSAYTVPVTDIPLLRRKIKRLQQRSGLHPNSHSGKTLRHLIHTFPRDEMLQASYEQLEATLFGMLDCEERRQLRIFMRPDNYGRFINALILVPRDHYDTALRLKMQQILLDAFDGTSSDFNVLLTDHALAQVQFTIHCEESSQHKVEVEALEAEMSEAMASWQDRLHAALMEKLGEADANRLLRQFGPSLPAGYRDDYSPRRAVTDLQRLAGLESGQLSTYIYRPLESYDSLHFKVLGGGESLALSDVLPILEQMGVRVLNARPYELRDSEGSPYWMLDFRLSVAGSFDPEDSHLKRQFQETFTRTYQGELENDGFNALVIAAGLSYRQVVILRALCKYLLQLGLPFSQSYMEQTLASNPHICRKLVQLFEARFDPDFRKDRDARGAELISGLEEALDAVENLDQDRILRHFLSVIQAMLRTNFYQRGEHGFKGYLSFKLATDDIPAAPQPRPKFEIFVYAPWVEGVHLRGGKVARGGLRWSDRREDFRTEVLGLVKAQLVKNAVIVPVGAKGGFVPKQLPSSRDEVMNEVIRCYTTFIRGLLDITDNRAGERIIPPADVVRHDEDDPYLVVAADKGTATFSDIANAISLEYGFWLGDAFASGGANGYDHKKMGITARGAWESVKRLFHERGIDCQREPFTAVGIGDMSGDVFGNGMLLSDQTCLVAAFNHMHIFIDPSPDPATSFAERKRLFELPRSTWDDYNRKLISKGGGIFPRSAKSITLSNEAREALGISASRLAPSELMQAILKAPVDLFWNGGIGTYVKASSESHDQVGDRANDAIRINGNELRAHIVGEGGNLGCTQRGRIEFAQNGGLINTDAIDNSGGVDSSDHEVNIKILLDQEVRAQDLTAKQRNKLLASMTDDVAALVLRHNYQQSQVLSLCNRQAGYLINDHRQLIQLLEKEGRLKRKLEFLPSDEQLEELVRSNGGLSRPEIAVLLAYSKLRNFDLLVEEGIGSDEDLANELSAYFPAEIRKRYPEQLRLHPLRQELIATHVTNLVVNRMGSTFVTYLQDETRCTALDAVRAFFAARDIFAISPLWQALEAHEAALGDELFGGLLIDIQQLLERAALWLLRTQPRPLSVSSLVENFAAGVQTALAAIPADTAAEASSERLRDCGLPVELAARMGDLPRQYYALDMVRLAGWVDHDTPLAAAGYLAMEATLGLEPLRDQITALPGNDLWSRKARASLADELDRALVRASERLLTSTDAGLAIDQRLTLWQMEHLQPLSHFQAICNEIATQDAPNLAMLSVAVRELGQLN